MGGITSRQNIGVEEVDISVNHAYRYPPKSGNYFSSHFIMGGERFDTAQPEMYLFGENTDLNFLGSRPAPFPYPAPSASEPSRTLKALVNIRKESLRFVRVPDDALSLKETDMRAPSSHFNIEFTFDCDVRCAITIMYFCTEEVTNTGLIYTPRDSSMNSETYHYKRGANQQFSQVCHIFDPSQYPEESLLYSFEREVMPIVIYCIAEEGEEHFQSHATIAVVDKHSDGYTLKPLKQKLFVDGLCYLLQEIYGIENKNTDSKLATEDDPDDNGAECVICMCDLRDTLILPCRHLCLCNCCADSLRYQANNCPICRAPFRALLQIKALQKSSANVAGGTSNTNEVKVARVPVSEGGVRVWSFGQQTHVFTVSNGENIPPGYEAVSLIEALNGPSVAPQQPTAPPDQDMYVQLPQNAIDGGLDGSLDDSDAAREFQERLSSKGPGLEDSMTQTERSPSACELRESFTKGGPTQMRMSVLMVQESEESVEGLSEGSLSPTSTSSKKMPKSKYPEDTVTRISETAKPKESSAVIVRKKSKKVSVHSPLTPAPLAKETNLCTTQGDEIEQELPETLGLLDDSKSENVLRTTRSTSSSSIQELPGVGREFSTDPKLVASRSQEGDDPEDVRETEPGKEDKIGAEFAPSMEFVPPVRSPSTAASRSCSRPARYEGKQTPKKSSKKNKQKSDRSSGRKDRSNSSVEYATSPHPDSLNPPPSDESNPVLIPESHSLPGTPLSHSSAVSRLSDASVSSASSTRALILSHPTQSTTI